MLPIKLSASQQRDGIMSLGDIMSNKFKCMPNSLVATKIFLNSNKSPKLRIFHGVNKKIMKILNSSNEHTAFAFHCSICK